MASGKVIIYLVRHAQTSGNVNMKMLDAESDVLTNLGQVQTNLLGMHLTEVSFDRVYSSDYNRAIKTAEGVLKLSKVSKEKPIILTPHLREVNFGAFEESSYVDTFRYCSKLNMPVFHWEFPEGESFPEVGHRIVSCIEEVTAENRGENEEQQSPKFLLISHSAAIACFLNNLHESTIHEVTGLEPEDRKLMRNTCYLKFEVERASGNDDNLDLTRLKFNFLEKFYSDHLNCISGLRKTSNPLANFAMSSETRKEYLPCVQQ